MSNSISPSITNMGGSRGQRWFRLPWYQHRGDRSSADVCAEYKNSLDLMTVARFQKCVPLCVYELWKLSDWGRGALSLAPPPPPPRVNLCLESGPLQIKLFDPAPLALSSSPVLRCRVHEQLWPIDRGSCVARTSPCRRISPQFISGFGRKKKKKLQLWK